MVIAFAVLTFLVSIIYSLFLWKKRKKEIARISRAKAEEKKANNASLFATLITGLLGLMFAVYSAITGTINDQKNEISKKEEKRHSDSLNYLLRQNTESLKRSSVRIDSLQEYNLQESKKIIEQQEASIKQTLRVISLQQHSFEQLSGGDNKPYFSFSVSSGINSKKHIISCLLRNTGKTNLRDVCIITENWFDKFDQILTSKLLLNDFIEYKYSTKSNDTVTQVHTPWLSEEVIEKCQSVPLRAFISGNVYLPRRGEIYFFNWRVSWANGSYDVQAEFKEINNSLYLKSSIILDSNSGEIVDVCNYFGTQSPKPTKFPDASVEYNKKKYQIFWWKETGKIGIWHPSWASTQFYDIFLTYERDDLKNNALKTLQQLNE